MLDLLKSQSTAFAENEKQIFSSGADGNFFKSPYKKSCP